MMIIFLLWFWSIFLHFPFFFTITKISLLSILFHTNTSFLLITIESTKTEQPATKRRSRKEKSTNQSDLDQAIKSNPIHFHQIKPKVASVCSTSMAACWIFTSPSTTKHQPPVNDHQWQVSHVHKSVEWLKWSFDQRQDGSFVFTYLSLNLQSPSSHLMDFQPRRFKTNLNVPEKRR